MLRGMFVPRHQAGNCISPKQQSLRVKNRPVSAPSRCLRLELLESRHLLAVIAVEDAYSTVEDTPFSVASPGVLANDSNSESDPIFARLASHPAHGAVTLNDDGAFTYTPVANYFGSDSFSYRAITYDGPGTVTEINDLVETGLPNVVGLAIDVAGGKIYWSSYSSTRIQRANLDGTVVQDVVSAPGRSMEIALDVAAGKIYWAENGTTQPGMIRRANLNGTGGIDDLVTGLGQPRGMALDIANGKMYWTDFSTGNVQRANMDGTSVQTIASGQSGPAQVAVDTIGGAVYWTEYFAGRIKRADLDGSSQQTIVAGQSSPIGIAVDNMTSKIYWNQNGGGTRQASLFGAAVEEIISSVQSGPTGIAIDAVGGLLYWAEEGSGKVRRGKLPGESSNTPTVQITVTPANEAPTANPDSYLVLADQPLNVAAASGLLANDINADGRAISAILVSGPTQGSLTLNLDGAFEYASTTSYVGPDSFTYLLRDSLFDSVAATVSLVVSNSPPPVGRPDVYATRVDTPLVVASASGVLLNDSDPENDSISVSLESQPAHGSVSLDPDGSFTYTPVLGYQGSDSFTYRVTNSAGVWMSGVPAYIEVTSVNLQNLRRWPIASGGNGHVYGRVSGGGGTWTIAKSASEGIVFRGTSGHLATITSAEEETWFTANIPQGIFWLGGYQPQPDCCGNPEPAGGWEWVTGESWSYTNWASGEPNNGSGTEHYLQVANTVGTWRDARINQFPTLGYYVEFSSQPTADSYTTRKNTPLNVVAPGVLNNDFAHAFGEAVATLVAGPSHGLLTLNSDGSFLYEPQSSFVGNDQFTYKSSPADPDSAATTVTINIPQLQANNDSYTLDQHGTLIRSVSEGVMTNDISTSGLPTTAALTSTAAHGSVLLSDDGSFNYTPNTGYVGTDQFSYTISDGVETSSSAVVSLTILENTPPHASNKFHGLKRDAALAISADQGVLSNDIDSGIAELTAILVNGPSHGGLLLDSDGSFIYTPDPSYIGSDEFTYRATDGVFTSNLATVSLQVFAQNVLEIEYWNANGHLYGRVAASASWSQAQNAVAGIQVAGTPAHLATLAAAEEQAWFADTLTPARYWLGGYQDFAAPDYFEPSGGWRWVTGEPWSFTDWRPGEPNNALGGEHFLELNGGLDEGGPSRWNDISNIAEEGYYFEIPLAASQADAYFIRGNESLSVIAPGVMANDPAVIFGAVSATLVTSPQHGELSLFQDGSFTYVPQTGFAGVDTFTYRPHPDVESPTTVTITVTPIIIDAVLRSVSTLTASTSVMTLPSSIASANVGESYFVELWVQDSAMPSLGISGGRLDLHYNTLLTDATSLVHGSPFSLLVAGTINEPAGLVDDFGGGTTSAAPSRAPAWARLGYVTVTATAQGNAIYSISQGNLQFSRFGGGGNVPWESVNLTESVTVTHVSGSRAELRVVTEPTATDGAGEVDLLPENALWLHEWQGFWVEVWLSTPTIASAIAGGSVDLQYDTTRFSAAEIQYGPAFTDAQSGTINDVTGIVDNLGGMTTRTDVGDDQFTLLARVRFQATGTDQSVVDEVGHFIGPFSLGLALADPAFNLVGVGATPTELGSPPSTAVWSVVYDIDDNNLVDFGDFSFFAAAFSQDINGLEPPYRWWADFTKSDPIVDFGDFSFFATNFSKARPAADILFPDNFPVAWGPGPSPILEMPNYYPTAGASPETASGPGSSIVELRLVANTAASPSDLASTLPESLTSVPVGESFVVEVWVQDSGMPGVGITGGQVDLSYPTARVVASALANGGTFTNFASGIIDDEVGLVDDLGGASIDSGLGVAPTWTRLGYIAFNVTSEGPIEISAAPGLFQFSRFGTGNVSWNDVLLGTLTLNAQTPSVGDLNRDGVIDRQDATILARNFGRTSGATPDQGDLTDDGRVGLDDLALLQQHLTPRASSHAAAVTLAARVHAVDAALATDLSAKLTLRVRRRMVVVNTNRDVESEPLVATVSDTIGTLRAARSRRR